MQIIIIESACALQVADPITKPDHTWTNVSVSLFSGNLNVLD